MQSSILVKACKTFVILASFAALVACGGEERGETIIVDDVATGKQGFYLYTEPGGLGGTTDWVNVGEVATIEESKRVEAGGRGVIPGKWVRIKTLYDPREGWIELQNTRPSAEYTRSSAE